MKTILIPVDGSEHSLHAIDDIIASRTPGEVRELHLLNVQHTLTGGVGRFLDQEQIRAFHREEGLKALAAARKRLDDAGLPYAFHIGVGDAAETILQYAREKRCDQIVMGSHGHGVIATLLMGSVAAAVSDRAEIPVKLVD
ncbi:MAG: universal stress protein [Methylotetracoccus sp.]